MEKLSVTAAVSLIKKHLESHFSSLAVEGEVSNLTRSAAGHYYFTLSDAGASLSLAVFQMDALKNPHLVGLKNGDKIVALGSIGVYAKRGSFQLIARQIFPAGLGDLRAQFEMLKKKLAAEGLFDLQRKKNIPKYPGKIAIISAKQGAALQDFKNIYLRRCLWMDLLLVPSLVQGEQAPASLRNALKMALEYHRKAKEAKDPQNELSAIVFCRGGGSMEDLWAFNDEGLAYDISRSPVPVISAVGHQVDFTICDFVADLRAETPSAAAEILTHAQTQLHMRLTSAHRQLKDNMQMFWQHQLSKVESFHPRKVLQRLWQNIQRLGNKLSRLDIRHRLQELSGIDESEHRSDEAIYKLQMLWQRIFERYHNKIEQLNKILKAISPQNTMQRGYSYLTYDDRQLLATVKDFDQVPAGLALTVHFYDGTANVIKE